MIKFVIAMVISIFLFSTVSFAPTQTIDSELHERDTDRALLMEHAVKIEKEVTTLGVLGLKQNVVLVTGSGVVIDVSRGKSLILTVHHVCEKLDITGTFAIGSLITAERDFVISKSGKRMATTGIVYKDESQDICVIGVDGTAGVPAAEAILLPEPGDIVYSAGAPDGIWDKGVAHIVDGYYIGNKREELNGFERFDQYSMHLAPGASGSAIFHKGRIVGLVSLGNKVYANVVWSPSLGPIRKAVRKSVSVWRDSL